tara:strand:- start:233 stop:487 length:255 start_codon:yes stop_codon:yes gene_type:complete
MKIFKISLLFIFSLSIYAFNIVEQDVDSDKVVCDSASELNAMGTCFKKSERTSGMNKICTYRCTSGDKSITIKATQLCPLSIKG